MSSIFSFYILMLIITIKFETVCKQVAIYSEATHFSPITDFSYLLFFSMLH